MANSKIFTCLIIDDWDSMHIILTDLLKPHRRVRIVGHCFNTLDAIEMIHKKKPDFIFLDIENAPYTGPEMLTKIPAQDLCFLSPNPNVRKAHLEHQKLPPSRYRRRSKMGLPPQLLQGEIDRIYTREARSKEIDQDKIQAKLHKQFTEQFEIPENNLGLTPADLEAVRLIVFQSLGYGSRQQVYGMLSETESPFSKDNFSATLTSLIDAQFSYMIRECVAGNTESRQPGNINAWCLEAVAKDVGLDVEAIKQAQQEIANEREHKLQERVKNLERMTEKLRQAAIPETEEAPQ